MLLNKLFDGLSLEEKTLNHFGHEVYTRKISYRDDDAHHYEVMHTPNVDDRVVPASSLNYGIILVAVET